MARPRGKHVKETRRTSKPIRHLIPPLIASTAILNPGATAAAYQPGGHQDVPGIPSSLSGSITDLSTTDTKAIPYPTRVVEDKGLPAGIEVVIQEGRDGVLKTVTGFRQAAGAGGAQHNSRVRHTYIDTPATEKVIRKGTKTEVIEGVADKVVQAEAKIAEQKKAEEATQAKREAEQQAQAAASPTSLGNSTATQNNSSGSGSTTPPPATQVTGTKTDWMRAAGIAESDWPYVDYIISHESGWDPNAINASSGAHGLPQALPGGKMASAGEDWATNPVTQLKWASGYAVSRYGSWAAAYNAWRSQNWW